MSTDDLEGVVLDRLERADRRWAARALAAVPVLLATLLVGASTTFVSAGVGGGARPGHALSWIALAVLVGVLVAAARPGRVDPSPQLLAAAGIAVAVIAVTLRSAVSLDSPTSWPLVGLLACAWVVGCVVAEALRQRDDPRADDPPSSVARLAAFRRSARAAVTDRADPK